MTKIERAEKAILQLQADGELPESFEITSMRIGNITKKLFVYGKASAEDPEDVMYYEWIEFDKVLMATVFKATDGATKYWNEDEGCIEPSSGLVEERAHELDVMLNDE